MQKLGVVLAATALILFTGAMVWKAQAATGMGAAKIGAAAETIKPAEPAACRGGGPHCPPGFTWTCRARGCWCRPCR
jgi:hypothetical protein